MPDHDDPPPPYEATPSGPSSTTNAIPHQDRANLTIPLRARNGIPPEERRSMEDSARPLPQGWIRQWDPQTHHQFFVDTTAHPPRSIWHHPYDDDHFMQSLPAEERQRVQGLQRVHSLADIEAESSDDDTARQHHHQQQQQQQQQQGLPPRPSSSHEKLSTSQKFGRKLKDKLTSSTHQERALRRRQRAEEEQRAYQQHLHIRRQISRSIETGEPQLLGKNAQGKEVWIEPPQGLRDRDRFGDAYVVSPWSNGYFGGYPGPGMYARPVGPYGRPYGRGNYGYGYGGGLGMGTGLGLGAGLGIGMLGAGIIGADMMGGGGGIGF